jgi:hypothetical protein
MKRTALTIAAWLGTALSAPTVLAFCGFYVAKADAKLFNRASSVVLVRNGDRTVLTMTNDFKGDPKEFAVVVPVPTVLEREQIHVGDRKLIEHLDAYTAPRLVEYFDGNPCALRQGSSLLAPMPMAAAPRDAERSARSLGVTIEARYTVGEYDIVILSARESAGLETWLLDQGYRIPEGASGVLHSYLRQGLRFFVARVNLAEHSRLGFTYLRPLQMAFESPRFMLPIRLGTVNADGPQELFVYALTRRGRVETTNYRTVKLPSDVEVPLYVKHEFPAFYRALFDRAVEREARRAVFLEYAWDMGWCDPCAADPLSPEELRSLGVFWLAEPPGGPGSAPARRRGGPVDVFVTRLHVRYDAAHFPEDLAFQETGDRTNFQGRYILRHPWTGKGDCEAAREYQQSVQARQERQAETLARLTGWSPETIRQKMGPGPGGHDPGSGPSQRPWWRRLWGNEP